MTLPEHIRLDFDPELFRTSAGLVFAYMWSNESEFWSLADGTPREIVQLLVAALFMALHLLAEHEDRSPLDLLADFCISAAHTAEQAEAQQ